MSHVPAPPEGSESPPPTDGAPTAAPTIDPPSFTAAQITQLGAVFARPVQLITVPDPVEGSGDEPEPRLMLAAGGVSGDGSEAHAVGLPFALEATDGALAPDDFLHTASVSLCETFIHVCVDMSGGDADAGRALAQLPTTFIGVVSHGTSAGKSAFASMCATALATGSSREPSTFFSRRTRTTIGVWMLVQVVDEGTASSRVVVFLDFEGSDALEAASCVPASKKSGYLNRRAARLLALAKAVCDVVVMMVGDDDGDVDHTAKSLEDAMNTFDGNVPDTDSSPLLCVVHRLRLAPDDVSKEAEDPVADAELYEKSYDKLKSAVDATRDMFCCVPYESATRLVAPVCREAVPAALRRANRELTNRLADAGHDVLQRVMRAGDDARFIYMPWLQDATARRVPCDEHKRAAELAIAGILALADEARSRAGRKAGTLAAFSARLPRQMALINRAMLSEIALGLRAENDRAFARRVCAAARDAALQGYNNEAATILRDGDSEVAPDGMRVFFVRDATHEDMLARAEMRYRVGGDGIVPAMGPEDVVHSELESLRRHVASAHRSYRLCGHACDGRECSGVCGYAAGTCRDRVAAGDKHHCRKQRVEFQCADECASGERCTAAVFKACGEAADNMYSCGRCPEPCSTPSHVDGAVRLRCSGAKGHAGGDHKCGAYCHEACACGAGTCRSRVSAVGASHDHVCTDGPAHEVTCSRPGCTRSQRVPCLTTTWHCDDDVCKHKCPATICSKGHAQPCVRRSTDGHSDHVCAKCCTLGGVSRISCECGGNTCTLEVLGHGGGGHAGGTTHSCGHVKTRSCQWPACTHEVNDVPCGSRTEPIRCHGHAGKCEVAVLGCTHASTWCNLAPGHVGTHTCGVTRTEACTHDGCSATGAVKCGEADFEAARWDCGCCGTFTVSVAQPDDVAVDSIERDPSSHDQRIVMSATVPATSAVPASYIAPPVTRMEFFVCQKGSDTVLETVSVDIHPTTAGAGSAARVEAKACVGAKSLQGGRLEGFLSVSCKAWAVTVAGPESAKVDAQFSLCTIL